MTCSCKRGKEEGGRGGQFRVESCLDRLLLLPFHVSMFPHTSTSVPPVHFLFGALCFLATSCPPSHRPPTRPIFVATVSPYSFSLHFHHANILTLTLSPLFPFPLFSLLFPFLIPHALSYFPFFPFPLATLFHYSHLSPFPSSSLLPSSPHSPHPASSPPLTSSPFPSDFQLASLHVLPPFSSSPLFSFPSSLFLSYLPLPLLSSLLFPFPSSLLFPLSIPSSRHHSIFRFPLPPSPLP